MNEIARGTIVPAIARARGVGHTVIVLGHGFEYDGQHWKSLSAIARAITGTNWNGPLFFGLAKRRKA
jgi:hypothetical protein